VRDSNDALLVWPIGADAEEPRRPVEHVASWRPGGRVRAAASSRPRAAGSDDGGRARRWLRALDRCRAALAVERGEVEAWARALFSLDPSSRPADYRLPAGGWDVQALFSDLRVARGRALLASLRCAEAAAAPEAAGEGRPPARLSRAADYCHGGAAWDISALRADLAITRRRLRIAAAEGRRCGPGRGGLEGGDSASPPLPPPLVRLVGAVDGVADEVVLTRGEGEGEGEESWALRTVVVEVKSRVRRIARPPALHDQLQAVAYSLMLRAEAAHLVQTLGEEMDVSPVELHGPPMWHAANFEAHVLPRLRAFAAAVQAMRADVAARVSYLCGDDRWRDRLLRERGCGFLVK